ncbi:MAG: hypothetical protein U5N53_22660 [Mycobacterium sp.]|nr:hypothetical protein [Mycobacterium sp.]
MTRDVRPPRRRTRRSPLVSIPVTLAVVALLYVVAALIARTIPLTNLAALVIAASFAYVPLLALCAVILAALCRKKLLSMIGVALLAISVAVQVPWHDLGRRSDPGPPSTELRILSSNIQKGEAHTAAFVGLAVESADIITMSELTAEAAARFREGGLRKTFPYSILIPRPGAAGMGLWSRYPLVALPTSKYGNNFIAARVRVPDIRDDPVVASVHLMSPLAGGANTFAAVETPDHRGQVRIRRLRRNRGPGRGDHRRRLQRHTRHAPVP